MYYAPNLSNSRFLSPDIIYSLYTLSQYSFYTVITHTIHSLLVYLHISIVRTVLLSIIERRCRSALGLTAAFTHLSLPSLPAPSLDYSLHSKTKPFRGFTSYSSPTSNFSRTLCTDATFSRFLSLFPLPINNSWSRVPFTHTNTHFTATTFASISTAYFQMQLLAQPPLSTTHLQNHSTSSHHFQLLPPHFQVSYTDAPSHPFFNPRSSAIPHRPLLTDLLIDLISFPVSDSVPSGDSRLRVESTHRIPSG